ncbi:MAG: excinuclease ABC subunit A, partial [Planctomycetaceae bacterium]|nr:excinuclease ABC subunit A [Planctomycetaceae bacterium]
GGESQRVALTAALGTGLIHTLYVLDEPTSGLHQTDTQRIITVARRLQQLCNTVVVVEHDPQFIAAADEVIETGPEAGARGGTIVFQGTPTELQQAETPTGLMLRQLAESNSAGSLTERAGGPALSSHAPHGSEPRSWVQMTGVRCHNIQGLDVRLPLETLCVVTGVSGSGKSSLIVDTLYPAVCAALNQPLQRGTESTVDQLDGFQSLSRVMLLDQSPLQKSGRSVPVTWVGAFDEIRRLLADTYEARKRNYSAGMFSFNSARGGRCPVCEGLGVVTIEMQFLADIQTTCDECAGRRFRPDVLEVRYRDRSVSEILEMTVDDAFTFFSGHPRIQQPLNAVRQAGLGYLRLGQPLSTLSGGEAQRLRIAALLAGISIPESDFGPQEKSRPKQADKGERTLFILDEPSTGLHMKDVDRLMTCLKWLVQTGHSVIVVEHDSQIVRHADHIIELGPGAGRSGGKIIAEGPADRFPQYR